MRRCLLCLYLVLVATTGMAATVAIPFAHPGLLQSREDLARIKQAVARQQPPIWAGVEVLRRHPQSQPEYAMRGPAPEIGRNPSVYFGEYDSDANAAYQCALLWCVTGDRRYADKAKQIVDGWSGALRKISGRDAILMAGFGPFKMLNAAELLRSSDAGWNDRSIVQAQRCFREVVYPVIANFAPFANGNWDGACIKTMMAIGVFCDDRPLFERAVNYYLHGSGDGAIGHYVINETGQCQESGRDQQHTQLGLGQLAEACEIAWHQGVDLYGAEDNRLLRGFEYTARYNLGEDVPFVETTDTTGKYHHLKISTEGRGRLRPIYEMALNHYSERKHLAAPYVRRAVMALRPEGAGFQADHVGFGTALFAPLDKSAAAAQ